MAIKPIIKYQATIKLPLEMDEAAIVRKRIDNTYTNFTNKADLTDFIDSLYVHPTSDTYMEVICTCGMDHEFQTKTNIPSTDFTCNCGKKIIVYSN